MSGSLLRKLLGKAARPGDPQLVAGSLSDGERVAIGPMKISCQGGDIAIAIRQGAEVKIGLADDGDLVVTNLAGRPDEGVVVSRIVGNLHGCSFVADVRADRAPYYEVKHAPRPDIPLCRFGPGGGFVHDWTPGEEDAETRGRGDAESKDDQAARLREAVAHGKA